MDTIQRFSEWRQATQLSFGEAAQKIKENKGTVYRIEKGQMKCPPQVLLKMVQVLEGFPIKEKK